MPYLKWRDFGVEPSHCPPRHNCIYAHAMHAHRTELCISFSCRRCCQSYYYGHIGQIGGAFRVSFVCIIYIAHHEVITHIRAECYYDDGKERQFTFGTLHSIDEMYHASLKRISYYRYISNANARRHYSRHRAYRAAADLKQSVMARALELCAAVAAHINSIIRPLERVSSPHMMRRNIEASAIEVYNHRDRKESNEDLSPHAITTSNMGQGIFLDAVCISWQVQHIEAG